MARKKYWKDEYEYKRILEILDDYWLTDPNEEQVVVTMFFKNRNGDKQEKVVRWDNPDAPHEKLTPYIIGVDLAHDI